MVVETYYSKDNEKIGGVMVTGFNVKNYTGETKEFITMTDLDVKFNLDNYYDIPCDKTKYMFAGGYKRVLVNGTADYKDEDIKNFLMCGKYEIMETHLDGIQLMGYYGPFDNEKHIEIKIVLKADDNSWSWSDKYLQN